MAVGDYWKHPLLRPHLRDGLIAHGNVRYLFYVVCSQAFITMLLAFPLWFFGRCVLVDSIADVLGDTFCRPFPFLYALQWWQFGVSVLLATSLYVGTYRWAVRRGWAVRVGNYYVTPAAVFSFVFGLEYGRWIAHVMTDAGTTTAYGRLLVVFAGPAIAWIWHVHTTLWMKWCAYTSLPVDEAAVFVSRLVLQRDGYVADGDRVNVRRDANRLIVTGGLDAVSAARLHDLVATSYPEDLRVVVETTLDDAAYYKHDHNRLARTRYDDKPLAPPAEIPMAVLIGGIGLFVVIVAVAFIAGPGFSPGLTGGDLQGFAAAEQRASSLFAPGRSQPTATEGQSEQPPEQGQRPETTLAVPAFALDLSDAEQYCPRLTESPPQRIFRMDTEHLVGMFMNPAHATDTTRYGDTVVRVHAYYNGTYTFAFDRRTGGCIEQTQHTSIAAARDAAQNDPRVVPGRWLDVPTNYDWHTVPPVPVAN